MAAGPPPLELSFELAAWRWWRLTPGLIRVVAGLAPLELLMTFDLAHKRGRCVYAGGNPQGRNFTSHRRCAESGNNILSKGRRGWGMDSRSLPVLVLL